MALAREQAPMFSIKAYQRNKIRLLITGNEVYDGLIEDRFEAIVKKKVTALGASLLETVILPDDPERIADAVRRFAAADTDMVITTGGMSVDPDDVTRHGIRMAGVDKLYYGAAVLPGAMFQVAYKNSMPIVGIPACGLYHQTTIFDLVLPRLLAGDTIDNPGPGPLCRGWDVSGLRCVPLSGVFNGENRLLMILDQKLFASVSAARPAGSWSIRLPSALGYTAVTTSDGDIGIAATGVALDGSHTGNLNVVDYEGRPAIDLLEGILVPDPMLRTMALALINALNHNRTMQFPEDVQNRILFDRFGILGGARCGHGRLFSTAGPLSGEKTDPVVGDRQCQGTRRQKNLSPPTRQLGRSPHIDGHQHRQRAPWRTSSPMPAHIWGNPLFWAPPRPCYPRYSTIFPSTCWQAAPSQIVPRL